jgi:hypothetical protein
VIVEEDRGQRTTHVPLDVVGEHAEEDVGPDPLLAPVTESEPTSFRRTTRSTGEVLQQERQHYDARSKLVRVEAEGSGLRGASEYTQWYSGLGNLVATDWDNVGGPEWQREEYRVDALGNVRHRQVYQPGPISPANDDPRFSYTIHPTRGHVVAVLRETSAFDPGQGPRDESMRAYDASGNQVRARQVQTEWSSGWGPGTTYNSLLKESHSYHDAGERLRYVQDNESRFTGGGAWGQSHGVWEEYRYDPLGRRIGVSTFRGYPLCDVNAETCVSAETRFVWAGDQILWEVKTPSARAGVPVGPGAAYGHVSYYRGR